MTYPFAEAAKLHGPTFHARNHFAARVTSDPINNYATMRAAFERAANPEPRN
jgi:hypothetical protein